MNSINIIFAIALSIISIICIGVLVLKNLIVFLTEYSRYYSKASKKVKWLEMIRYRHALGEEISNKVISDRKEKILVYIALLSFVLSIIILIKSI